MADARCRAALLRSLLCALLAGAQAGCGGNARAPVEDRAARAPAPPIQSVQRTEHYRVQRGDTLYSIAFRYGLDFRKLAAANDIAPPYTIYPGQRLALSGAAPPPPTAGGARAEATPDAGPAAAPAPAPPATAVSPAPSPTAVSPAPSPAARVYRGRPVERWRWPSSGRVLRGFSASVHKGIDLDGRRGDPVHAAGDGVVVYAGTGIVGLGELLIIKHNEEYLSAYGHNEQLLVAEGTVVTAGQRIAEKGGSGTDRVKLHFEIRRAGKPVDPLRLLPPR